MCNGGRLALTTEGQAVFMGRRELGNLDIPRLRGGQQFLHGALGYGHTILVRENGTVRPLRWATPAETRSWELADATTGYSQMLLGNDTPKFCSR